MTEEIRSAEVSENVQTVSSVPDARAELIERQREIASKGGRSVPAKSLTTFTNGLLTLHGQNDQLRLMRPDEQRAALDRYADVGHRLERYRSVREQWLGARRDLEDRRRRTRRR